MTVSYSASVSNTQLSAFLKLLLRWRGSVFKLLWRELLIFLVLYYFLNFSYRFALNESQKGYFEVFAHYCDKYASNVPLTFVLGFYVSIVYNRWWAQFQTIAWPDRIALYITSFIRGDSEKARNIRRTCIRYMNLAQVLGMRIVSSAIHRKYPTIQHIIDAGLLRDDELVMLDNVRTDYPKEFIPLTWAATLICRAKYEGLIDSDRFQLEMLREVNDFRQIVRSTRYYDWIAMPLVYTQVVSIAVYSFYVACLMGRQGMERSFNTADSSEKITWDHYFPGFTILQLIIYIGWLKVAEVMMNPFGEDDDDFEVPFILERNQEVGYIFVDELHNVAPKLMIHVPEPVENQFKKTREFLRCGYFGSTPAAIHPKYDKMKGVDLVRNQDAKGSGFKRLFRALGRKRNDVPQTLPESPLELISSSSGKNIAYVLPNVVETCHCQRQLAESAPKQNNVSFGKDKNDAL